jgi:signal transduction histidine kinase
MAEVTLTTETSLEDYKDMAASTIEACDRLLDMINTMLVISETEAGVGKRHDGETDLALVVREACALFLPLAEDRGLTLTCRVPDECIIHGDVRMIQRLIANLLDNAIKYTPQNGTVEVAVRMEGARSVIVLVKDTGIGISEKDLPHIFERFYRCDPSRPQTGIGLGLSLAQAIASSHGGRIAVTSIPGKGSTFRVKLPISPKEGS